MARTAAGQAAPGQREPAAARTPDRREAPAPPDREREPRARPEPPEPRPDGRHHRHRPEAGGTTGTAGATGTAGRGGAAGTAGRGQRWQRRDGLGRRARRDRWRRGCGRLERQRRRWPVQHHGAAGERHEVDRADDGRHRDLVHLGVRHHLGAHRLRRRHDVRHDGAGRSPDGDELPNLAARHEAREDLPLPDRREQRREHVHQRRSDRHDRREDQRRRPSPASR